MFGFGKKKKAKGQKPTRDALLAQAKENARKAREHIGEETLERIALALKKKEQSAVEQAKDRVKAMDRDKVADHIRLMIDEDK